MNSMLQTVICPVESIGDGERISLAHGDGGRLTRSFIHEHILPLFHNDFVASMADSTVLPNLNGPPLFTTDSFVVSPLVFPGGDIGKLCVYGTVNDLAVGGARPLWLSVSLIIEEGQSIALLRSILQSIADAARVAGVTVATGDTKVVPRGTADGLFITTSGIGELVPPAPPGPCALERGDELIVTGPVGRHGVAILTSRENLGFDPPPESDCAPLFPSVDALRQAGVPLRCMRDATRGGVTTVLHEWAEACQHTLSIDESAIPISADVKGACELLGLDPLNMANEGTMLVAVPAGWSERAVDLLRGVAVSRDAARIGEVRPRLSTPVTVRRSLGIERPLDEPLGTPLPRIC